MLGLVYTAAPAALNMSAPAPGREPRRRCSSCSGTTLGDRHWPLCGMPVCGRCGGAFPVIRARSGVPAVNMRF